MQIPAHMFICLHPHIPQHVYIWLGGMSPFDALSPVEIARIRAHNYFSTISMRCFRVDASNLCSIVIGNWYSFCYSMLWNFSQFFSPPPCPLYAWKQIYVLMKTRIFLFCCHLSANMIAYLEGSGENVLLCRNKFAYMDAELQACSSNKHNTNKNTFGIELCCF